MFTERERISQTVDSDTNIQKSFKSEYFIDLYLPKNLHVDVCSKRGHMLKHKNLCFRHTYNNPYKHLENYKFSRRITKRLA